jgi:hypothetical protein
MQSVPKMTCANTFFGWLKPARNEHDPGERNTIDPFMSIRPPLGSRTLGLMVGASCIFGTIATPFTLHYVICEGRH